MNETTLVTPGRYRHYKGNEYTVVGMARHSETLEEMVVYRPEYGEHGLWVRPAKMFLETVNMGGQIVPRFQPIGPQTTSPENRDNLFANVPLSLPTELIQALLTAGNVRIERIVSHGHASP